jgi:hypothetical protein
VWVYVCGWVWVGGCGCMCGCRRAWAIACACVPVACVESVNVGARVLTCAFACVALLIQHARSCHSVICGLSLCTISFAIIS